jgi:DNA repair exonuclease SbcCD nuclease subunit
MANLFNKAAVFGDIHYGAKSNSDLHNDDCESFIKWFISESKKHGCDTCLFLGDYHNNRNNMNLKTMNYAIHGLEMIADSFSQTFFIPGNHDLFFKDKRTVNSVRWAEHIQNVHIINDWFNDGNVIIAPWLVHEDAKKLKKYKGKYMFGHFELPGFYMNSLVKMPDHGEISGKDFKNIEHCFSGHFHKRQTTGNITYIGNAFPLSYSDAWDDDRGMMILEWDKDPVFISWPDQPTFRTIKMSKLMADMSVLKPKQYLRVTMDVDVSYEESTMIKEEFCKTYQLRELVLLSDKKSEMIEDSEQLVVASVDQTIINQIVNFQSEKFDNNLLLNIYTGL